MAAMCVMVGEEREREGGQVRQAVSEHVYHCVRERESERQTANGTEEKTDSDLRQFNVEVWFHPTFFFQTRDTWDSVTITVSCIPALQCGCTFLV